MSRKPQAYLRMVERARERMASAPNYPDDPEDIAEQEAITEAMLPYQLEAMAAIEHIDAGAGRCEGCGCAYPCPGSVVPTPVEPVSLTRGGFMPGR